MSQDNSDEFQSGAALLAAFGCATREEKLTQAVKALMETVDGLHVECKNESLADKLDDHDCFCSCADAYRMGHEALK